MCKQSDNTARPILLKIIIFLSLSAWSYSFAFIYHGRIEINRRINPSKTILNSNTESEEYTSPLNNIVECHLPSPNQNLDAFEVVTTCLTSLQQNNEPYINAGLEICFNFSNDRTRAALGGDVNNFIIFANNPTFGAMVNLKEWSILSIGPEIAGTNTRGAMRTVLTSVISTKNGVDKERKFLWTLQKERRPPKAGYWLIQEVLFVDNAFHITT